MAQNENFKQWLSGIPYELAFWNNVCRWNHTFSGMMQWSHYGSLLELEGMDAQAFLREADQPVVLDIGCGMSFANGNRILTANGEQELDVHYIDPLAIYYNRINQRHQRSLPNIEFGMMEYLSATYQGKPATLAIIRNALDHSASPMQGIMEALRVLSIGGCLYLNHHPNEAEAEHYKGFHKFNICLDDAEHLIIWNKEQRILVDEQIAAFASMRTLTLDNGYVVAIITKTAECPPSTSNATRKALLDNIEASTHSIGFRMKYQWYNALQFVAQSLTWEQKQKLRRIIYG